jgi:hypothetical protein
MHISDMLNAVTVADLDRVKEFFEKRVSLLTLNSTLAAGDFFTSLLKQQSLELC